MSSVKASTIDSSIESIVDEIVVNEPFVDESNDEIIKNESLNDISQINPLIAAVNNGNVDLVKQLIESSIDVNVEDSDGKFPLLIASLNGFSDIVKVLIESKADIDKELSGVTSISAASAYAKHVDILKLLIDGGANVNIPLSDGRSPLYLAASSDDLELVTIFIDAKADLNTSDSEQITPLMLAASNNQIEVVKALVTAGCQLDLKMNNGKTALILAVERGFADVVNLLIDANADLTIYDSERHSAVYYACEYDYADILAQLIKAGVNIDNQLESLLHIATENNHIDIIAYFVNNDYELDPKDLYSRVTPLFIAAENGYLDIVKLLIKGKLDINRLNRAPYTLGQGYLNSIAVAALNQHNEIVKILIEANADLDATILDGYTILYYISEKGYYDIAKLLIGANADVNRSDPLKIAMKEGHMDIAELLVNSNAKIWDAQTNLRYAIENKHIEFVNLFLSLDVNVDFEYPPDYYGHEIQTPLSIAIKVGSSEIVKILIDKGSKLSRERIINIQSKKSDDSEEDEDESTTQPSHYLYLAASQGFLDIVKVLLDNNVDINEISNGNTAISGAARHGHINVVMYLVQMNADLRIAHPMSDAMKSGSLETIKYLIESKCIITNEMIEDICSLGYVEILKYIMSNKIYNNIEQSFFISACRKDQTEIVEYLIELGVDINEPDQYGNTGLMEACMYGHIDVVKCLLNHKVAINKTNIFGENALSKTVYGSVYEKVDRKLFLDILRILVAYEGCDVKYFDDGEYLDNETIFELFPDTLVFSCKNHLNKRFLNILKELIWNPVRENLEKNYSYLRKQDEDAYKVLVSEISKGEVFAYDVITEKRLMHIALEYKNVYALKIMTEIGYDLNTVDEKKIPFIDYVTNIELKKLLIDISSSRSKYSYQRHMRLELISDGEIMKHYLESLEYGEICNLDYNNQTIYMIEKAKLKAENGPAMIPILTKLIEFLYGLWSRDNYDFTREIFIKYNHHLYCRDYIEAIHPSFRLNVNIQSSKVYYECYIVTTKSAIIGVYFSQTGYIFKGGNIALTGIGIDGCNQKIYPGNDTFVPKWKEGTVVGVLIDKTSDELSFSFDGELIKTNQPISTKHYQNYISPAFTLQNLQTSELIINFGETPLRYKPLDYLSVYEYSISKYHTFPEHLEFSNFKKECWEPLTPSIGCMKRYYNDLTDAFIDPSNRYFIEELFILNSSIRSQFYTILQNNIRLCQVVFENYINCFEDDVIYMYLKWDIENAYINNTSDVLNAKMWFMMLDSSIKISDDHRVRFVGRLLKEFNSRNDYDIKKIIYSKDVYGRRGIDIASQKVKNVIYKYICFCGRYDIHNGPPIHRSSTSLVMFANDLQIVEIYSEVFIQAVREEELNENKIIKSNQSKTKNDIIEKNYNGLLSRDKFINCVDEIRIKLGITVQADDREVLGQHFQKWKSDLIDGIDHSQFFSYCKSTYGEYHKVAIKFMKNRDQYERELLIRKSHGPYSLDSRYIVLYIDGPKEKHFQREAEIFTKRYTNNQDIMCYGFIMPAADRNLENICRQENPDMIHIHTILTEVALSLNSCHETGLVHNDLKLQNVVRVHNAIKLIDMDAAGAIGHDYSGAKFSSGILPPEMFIQLNDKEKELYDNYWSDVSDIGMKEKIKPKEFIEISGKIKKVKKTYYFVVKTFKAKNLERTLNDIEDDDEDDFLDKDDDKDESSVDSDINPTDSNKISKLTNSEVVILSDQSNDDPESLSIPLNSQQLPYQLVNSTPLIDIWSFGILMYRLISRQPFIIVDDDEDIPTGKDIFELVNLTDEQINSKINSINRSDCEYQHLEAAKDLMKKLLRKNPTDRIESVIKVLEHPYFTGKSDITSDLRKISEMQQQLNNKVDDIKEIVVEIKSITLDIQSSVIDVSKIVQLDTDVSLDIIKQLHLTQETLLRGIFEATEVTIPTCFIIVPEDIMLEMEKKAFDERLKLSKNKNGNGKKKLWMSMPSYVNMAANLTNAYNNQHDFIPKHLLDSVDKIAIDFFLTEYYINLKSEDTSTNGNVLQSGLKTDKLSNFIHWLTDVTTTVVNAVNNPIDSVATYVSSGGNKMYFYLIDELDMTPIIGEPNYPIQITSPSEFAVKYLSFIKIGFKAISMINGLSGIARCFGYPVPSISTECMSSLNTFVNSLNGETSISQYELLQEKALSCYDESITKESKPTSVRGPALRELENFLLLSDPLKKFSSLRRVFTKEGLSMWTCKTDEEIVSYKASLPDDYQIKNNEYKEYIKQNNLKHIKWNNDDVKKIDEVKIIKINESHNTETDNSISKVITDNTGNFDTNDSYNKRSIDKQVNSNESSVSVTQVVPIDKHTDVHLTSDEYNANVASRSPATQGCCIVS